MERPKTSNKKMSWFGIVSVFMLAIALAVGVSTNAQAATGSFDRDAYLPSLSDTNDFDRAWISVTDTSKTGVNAETIDVTIRAGTNEAQFTLLETGGTTTVFTTSGSSQPAKTAVGSTTGYVEDFAGSHNYTGLATGITGLKFKGSGISSSGVASDSTSGELKVTSGDTLQLLYSGSTLDTALVKFNGTNDSTITFIKESSWGNSITGSADSENPSVVMSINDPDENLNPKVKDVIGFQNGFTAGLTGTGSSRVQMEAIDQTSGNTLSIGSDVITRSIWFVETGANTGIFAASGKVYGSTTATLQGNVTTGSATTSAYTGSQVTLGGSANDAAVTLRILGANANGALVLYNINGTSSTGRTALAFTTGTTVPGSSSVLSEGDIVAIGTRTSTWDGTNHGTSTAYGDTASSQGLLKLYDGNNFCIVDVVTFLGSSTSTGTFAASTTPITAVNGGIVANGTRSVNIGSFVLTGPRSGDTIKLSYLDELNSNGIAGTVTSSTAFGAAGETGALSVSAGSADVNDFITVTVVDGNLNASDSSRGSSASESWAGTTTNSRGDRLTAMAYSSSSDGVSNKLSLSHPDGSGVGTQTVRISNSSNSLVWVVPSSLTGTFQSQSSFGSTTFSLGTQAVSNIPLVKGTTGDAKSFLGGASKSSFVATLDAADNTVEISPDGTHWIAVPVVETGINSSTFVGTIGFDCTAARITTSTTRTAANTFSDFTGTSTITFGTTEAGNATLTSSIGTGSVVRISDGSFTEFKEVTGVTNSVLTVEKMSNSSFLTPWKTWVQVVGNDMSTDRVETLSTGPKVFRIGGYYGATYRIRYNDALDASNAYLGGDTLAITTSNVAFQTSTGGLSVSPSGTVGLNSEMAITLVDNDLNTSVTTAQATFNNTGSIDNLNEVGVGVPSGTSTGNTSFRNGGIAKQIFASRATSITSSDFSNTSNTVSILLTETDTNTGTFKGTFKLSAGSDTVNTQSPLPILKTSSGDTITVFYNDSPSATLDNGLSAYTTVSVISSGGAGSLSLSKSEAFLSGDSVVVTLIDNDLNSTSGLDTGNVKAKSSSDDTTTNGVTVALTETAANAGTFKGTFTTASASNDTTDAVRAVANGNITVTYADASPAADITAQVSTKNFGAVLAFTSDSVVMNGNAEVTLYDPESNIAIGTANLVTANVTSTTDSTGTTVRLTETGVDTGSFLGTIAVSTDSSLSNTRIKAAVGDTLTTTFTDSPNASGSISTVTDTVTVAVAVTPTPVTSPTVVASPTPVTSPTATPVTSPTQLPPLPSPTELPPLPSPVVSPTELPPLPSPTVSPTPTVCEAEKVTVSKTTLRLKRKKSDDVTVTVTGADDCAVEGETVTATINAAGKKRISISTTSATTDASGAATFTITAKKKTGNARVTFKAGSVKKSITVKVKK